MPEIVLIYWSSTPITIDIPVQQTINFTPYLLTFSYRVFLQKGCKESILTFQNVVWVWEMSRLGWFCFLALVSLEKKKAMIYGSVSKFNLKMSRNVMSCLFFSNSLLSFGKVSIII